MKKYLLLVLIATVSIAFIADAQIKKGAIFLGGDIGGNTSRTQSADTGLLYTVSKKLQLEAGFNELIAISYSSSKTITGNAIKNEYKTTGFDVSSSLDNFSSLYFGFRLLLN